MSYYDSNESTTHCISAQKQASMFTEAWKENTLPTIKKKKNLLHDKKF